ncbi:GNAT family N-acetyltransferase [Shewanella sp. UCD-KL21]|uniref:GNAT family N-acetyltransferase n=1 Tax=Shewanella sp. UCD-KL21 TaxID=1917164 RepID=UPI0009713EF3|nr:GNAT family N-acetyltransferase [Shewanella sp. UCD-KL21]
MIRSLTPDDFQQVIALGNRVHGAGYLDFESLEHIYQLGIKNNINAHFVAVMDAESAHLSPPITPDQIIGFRLTYAPDQWPIDQWCNPEKWPVTAENMCYFKCNTVAEAYRGQGIGSKLLQASIAAVKQQGASAGVSHLWKQSPNNSAVGYFTQAGGQLIKQHPNRWNQQQDGSDYLCVICGDDCHCTACEMVVVF